MNFNSIAFISFFIVVYFAYLILKRSHRAQNILLLAASHYFYASWDWRFSGLLVLSTFVDYTIARSLEKSNVKSTRKWLLIGSVIVNLSILGFFKYFGFFAESFVSFAGVFGLEPGFTTLSIILPIGISFYTFQTLGYSIDVYRGETKAEKNLVDYALYVAFFPQLIAGPIERAGRLIPRIKSSRTVTAEDINAGTFLILWGFFKKVVVADQLAMAVDKIFTTSASPGATSIVIAAVMFAFQIYCDFSGYTDIARGIARLLGFDLMLNFRLPYFSKSPSDFWRRWHISLSSWIRDYVYIPLGGNSGSKKRILANLMIAMSLAGLWHGAAWNFVIWGIYHGVLLSTYSILSSTRFFPRTKFLESRIGWVVQVSVTFTLITFGWMIFRAESITQLGTWISAFAQISADVPDSFTLKRFIFIFPVLAMQLLQLRTKNLLAVVSLSAGIQTVIYSALVLGILVFGVMDGESFIYFQF
jgi:alginate O-acetyltransferase complex protein AlgI